MDQPTPSPAPQTSSPKQSVGPLIGIVIIIIVLIIGALYVWGGQLNRATPQTVPTQTLGTSDNINSIATDLASVSLDNTVINSDVAGIQQQVNGQ